MALLITLVLGFFAVMACCAAVLHTLLAFIKWHEFRQRNRERKALGLPPLSGIHRW